MLLSALWPVNFDNRRKRAQNFDLLRTRRLSSPLTRESHLQRRCVVLVSMYLFVVVLFVCVCVCWCGEVGLVRRLVSF